MTEFRILPVVEALTWIWAWTDRAWPISLGEAFSIRDHLGWIPSPREGRFFVTKLSLDGEEDGIIGRVDGGGIKRVRFSLTSLAPLGEEGKYGAEVRAAYEQYVDALANLWGPGKKKVYKSAIEFSWVLPSRVSVFIVSNEDVVEATIESPWITQVYDEEAYYEEEGYEQEMLLE